MTVNVCMITYNHEDYIVEAIESILSQTTKFSVQLIIGEDNSTDRTKEICRTYANKFPEKIIFITSDTNVGMMQNFLRVYRKCNGKYIAFTEGDDYWTDPLKLQKQINFLEANTDYSACFHNVLIKSVRNGEEKEWIMHEKLSKDNFHTKDILGPWFIPSPSFVFVNYPDFEIPDWFFNCTYGDLPIMLLLSLRGKFKYLSEVMGVYRLHDKGFTTKHMGYDKIIVMTYIYQSFNIHTNYKFKEQIREAVIYEITRHIPKDIFGKDLQESKKNTIIKRGFQKVKRLIQNDKI